MAYTTPPTFTSTTLSASQLNILSDDIEYLYGMITGVNLPVASLRIVNDNYTSTNNQWLVRHAHRYLHYKVRLVGGTNDSLSIYYDGVRVWQDPNTRNAAYTYSGYADLNSPETWPDWIGAYGAGTTYGKGDIVSSSSVYYVSKDNANTGNAVSNTSWWRNIGAAGAFATAGQYYAIYLTSDKDGSIEMSADYLLEADATSL